MLSQIWSNVAEAVQLCLSAVVPLLQKRHTFPWRQTAGEKQKIGCVISQQQAIVLHLDAGSGLSIGGHHECFLSWLQQWLPLSSSVPDENWSLQIRLMGLSFWWCAQDHAETCCANETAVAPTIDQPELDAFPILLPGWREPARLATDAVKQPMIIFTK